MVHADKLVWLTRLGFAARGLLYLIIAWLVIGSGRATDLSGALEYVREERVLLIAILIGFVGYGFWRVTDALFDSEGHGDGKKGTLALNEWYQKYAKTEMKDTKLCFAFIHDPGSIHGKKKIVVPSDLNGVKVRPAQSTIGEMVKLFGGTNVQASAPESRDAIERGVADEIAFPWGSIFLFGIDKVVKYHIDVPLYSTVFTYNINLAKYNSMSAAQKKIIDDHCTPEWASKVTDPWVDFEANGRTKMKALPDHEVYKLTPEQLAEWKKGVQPLNAAWAAAVKKAGGDADAIDADLKAMLKKHDAGL